MITAKNRLEADQPYRGATMKRQATILAAMILLIWTVGCAAHQPVCRHNAIATGIMLAEDGKDVRIVSYQIPNGNRHAEAQYREGREWRYISLRNGKTRISDEPDFRQSDVHYYGLHEYLLHIGVKSPY